MNDVNFPGCKFRADIVPYMYAELATSDRSAFESHLLNCVDCTDEFAAISSSRFEVYDWKRLEFDGLATPVIEISYGEDIALHSAPSWTEKVRAAFGQRWELPIVAFAALAVVSIFAAAFVLSRDSGGGLVAEAENSNTPAVNRPVVTGSEKIETVSQEKIEDRRDAESRPLQFSAPQRAGQRHVVRNAKLTQPRSVEVKQTSAQNQPQKIPRLNEFAEEEDTSLRLAELFEDIETRD